jgi:hypothetical protein
VTAVRPGDRVCLIVCTDDYTRLVAGTEGEVALVDALGTVHVRWDDGSTLGLVPAAGDRFEVVEREGAG